MSAHNSRISVTNSLLPMEIWVKAAILVFNEQGADLRVHKKMHVLTTWRHQYSFLSYLLWFFGRKNATNSINSLPLGTCFFVIYWFLAHLSRRLMGELIVYQSLRRPSVVRPQFQTSSPLKPLGQSNSNSYGDSSGRGTKVCSNGPGHMTKMATMPIYGKNPLKIFFSRTRRLITSGLGM